MRSRLVVLAAVSIAAVAVAFTGSRFILSPSRPLIVRASLPPRMAHYLGVFEPGAPPSFSPVDGFTKAAGEQPNVVGYFSGWVQPFDLTFARMLHSHGITPFVQIDPTFASLSDIAAGDDDSYLQSYADSVKAFGHPVIIGFGQEMNAGPAPGAPGYSWGYKHTPASTFVAAWRHIWTVFREAGALNVTWLWTVQADGPGTGPIQDWWPGSKYVSWVGIDGFYYRPSDSFRSIFALTIRQVRVFASKKPILLSETAVGPKAGQFTGILNLFKGMIRYRTLGLVWFDVPQHGSIYHQDWRIEGDGLADASFKLGVKDAVKAATHP
jgi:mannan endo-1,4-beta-mannosidase